MKITDKKMGTGQAYEARGVIAKYLPMGFYQSGVMIKVPVYRFLTLHQGEGREALPVEFKKPAPVIPGENGETFLNIEALEEGDIVVTPGLVYRKCFWFPNLTAAHMNACKTYKPKTIIVAEKDDAPAVDLGTLDATTDQVTKYMKPAVTERK